MSRSIDLFIDSAESLAEIASVIAASAGATSARPDDEEEWAIGFEGIEAHLGRHRYLDDGVLPLSSYPFCPSARVSGSASAAEPLPTSARLPPPSELPLSPPEWDVVADRFRLVAGQLRARGGFSCLLVIDLEFRDPGDER